MCGIAGIVDLSGREAPPAVDLLRAMIAAIRYRGPDEFGFYRDHWCGLANARLSIIDLECGKQPMSNEDGTLWVTFNGEIYNYLGLKKDLEARGHRFRSRSDTEVIVHAFEEWGEDCFLRFNGQWAIALWDARRRELTLSRDRVGICPLFVHEEGRRIWFGSEIKAIFADPRVPRNVDLRGLDQTFTYWASVAPQTFFEGVQEVLPGSIVKFGFESRRSERVYWRPMFSAGEGSPTAPRNVEEAAVALREKLQRATALRMLRSDVPVGSYLSGGLDSSFAVRLGREAKEGPFATFSLCFDDAEFDESHYQRLVARTLESEHVEVHITRADIARVFPEVIYHTEKPILRTAPAPMFLLSKAVRDAGIKAVLAGEGGDEFLGGYDLYREAKIREFWSRDPKSVTRPKLFERIYPYLARSPQHAKGLSYEFWRRGLERVGTPGFSHEPRWWTTALLKKFYSRDVRDELTRLRVPDPLEDLPPEFQQWDLLGRAQYLEVVTLFSSYLISSQGDRMLLGHSVEGRFPYLDPEVIEFAGSLPSFYKLAGLDEKHVLKRAARGLVPDQVHQRKKQPYRAPDAVCFIGRNAPEFVADALSASAIGAARLFDPRAVESLLAKCDRVTEGGVADGALSNTDNMAVVGILSAQLVHEQFARATIKQDGGEMTFTTTIDRVLCESPAHLED